MKKMVAILVTISSIGCSDHSLSENKVGHIQFGPHSSEQEIRTVFGINGDKVNIETLHQQATQRNITFEDLKEDRSLLSCNITLNEDDRFEHFASLNDRRNDVSPVYIVVYDKGGDVICIETRHMTRSL